MTTEAEPASVNGRPDGEGWLRPGDPQCWILNAQASYVQYAMTVDTETGTSTKWQRYLDERMKVLTLTARDTPTR